MGSKRHILTDARGAPLAVVVSGANAHDMTCAVAVLEALGRQLNGLGIEVELVESGQRAITRLRENPAGYSLFVTDMDMPGLDGRALIGLVQGVAPALPVLVITGSAACDPVPGARAVLAKPVSTVELAAAAARCLGVAPAA